MANSKDHLAMILLCVDFRDTDASIMQDKKKLKSKDTNKKTGQEAKRFTIPQWNKIEEKLLKANLTPEVFLIQKSSIWGKLLDLTPEEQFRIEHLLLRAEEIGAELEALAGKHIYVVTRAEKRYPTKLLKAMGKYAPPVLFVCGPLQPLEEKTAAIVGTRKTDPSIEEFTRKQAKIVAQNGCCIVSGGARGVDTIAIDTGLKYGGKTAIFISDHMLAFVENKQNAEYISRGQMTVLSSIHPQSVFRGYHALERNKYIYSCADYAIVVSAGDQTGGSYHGAEECLKKNYTRLYVREEEGVSPGNLKLIAMGAKRLNTGHELIF